MPLSTNTAPRLCQVQGNFPIRRAQAETATEIMSPRSGENTVLQVNMGEGKSSVIIPIAAAALADGKQLVRVIVPKALTVQMFELLVARLGGLTGRPIYHLPFSRTPEYRSGRVISLPIDDLHKLMSQCMAERGILLVQPEHVVSLKLMSVEEQMRKTKLMTDPLTKHQKRIYKYIKTALSLRSVCMDNYISVIIDSAYYRIHRYRETAMWATYFNCWGKRQTAWAKGILLRLTTIASAVGILTMLLAVHLSG
jgi:hypothetical protein